MIILNFPELFKTEEQCIQYLRRTKEDIGITCSKCNSTEHYWNSHHLSHDCKKCGHRTRLRVGTVMESSKLPIKYWIYAMYFMVSTKKGISASELQRQLGHKRYEPIWAMMHKLRSVMGKDEMGDPVTHVAEFKESTIKAIALTKGKKVKKKSKDVDISVLAQVSWFRPNVKKGKVNAFHKVKMVVNNFTESFSNENSKVFPQGMVQEINLNDSCMGFLNVFDKADQIHKPKLSWVKTMISNIRRNVNGMYHNIHNKYLQNYLHEFCFRMNNRNYGNEMFEYFSKVALKHRWNGNRIIYGYTDEDFEQMMLCSSPKTTPI